MEAQFLKNFPKAIDWCYKDRDTIYLLHNLSQSSNLAFNTSSTPSLELLTLDLLQHTVASRTEPPLFEGLHEDDTHRYLLLRIDDGLLLVYPNNIVVVYQHEEGDRLRVERVVQSMYNIVCPKIVGVKEGDQGEVKEYMVFMDQPITKPMNPSQDHDKLFFIKIEQIDELSKKGLKQYFIKSPFKSGQVQITDISKMGEEDNQLEVQISFSNGNFWHVNLKNPSQKNQINSIEHFRDQLGEQKVYQINSIDTLTHKKHGTLTLIADSFGRISLMKSTPSVKFLFFEQLSYNQILTARWLNKDNMNIAFMTSDGSLTLGKFHQNLQHQKFDFKKLSQITNPLLFEEVPNQFNFASQSIRMSNILQINGQSVGVLWPEKILYKINKKTAEKKVIISRKVCLFKIQDNQKNNKSIVFATSKVPRSVDELIPAKQDAQVLNEPYLFFIEDLKVCLYQVYDGKKRELFNLEQVPGMHQRQEYKVVKIEVRPHVIEESEVYRFFISVQMSEGEKLCLSIHYNNMKGQIMEAQQFFAQQTLVIGKAEQRDPIVMNLQEDQKTLQIIAFDQKLDKFLPRNNVTLLQKVKQVFWTPFCQNAAVIYDIQGESLLRFSKNRLETNQINDYSILAQSKYSFKLSFDERVSDLQWNRFNQKDTTLNKGFIVTNQRIVIVDSNLGMISQHSLNHNQTVSRSLWFGETVIFSTERHLNYLTQSKTDNHGIIMSFTTEEPSILAAALTDRVVLASGKTFLNKQIIMLECLLLGYIASISKNQTPDFQLIKRALVLLETSMISETLINKLITMNMNNSANFLMKHPQISQQFELRVKLNIAKSLPDNADHILELLSFGNSNLDDQSNLDTLIHRIKNEADSQFERSLIKEQMQNFISLGQYRAAYKCAELLFDIQSALKILQKAGQLQNIKQSIEREGFNSEANGDVCHQVKSVKMSKAKRFGIPEERYSAWMFQVEDSQDVKNLNQKSTAIDRDIENVNRLNLGYDEAPFSQVTKVLKGGPNMFKVKFMHSVVNTNLANWVGLDSLVADNNEGNNKFIQQPQQNLGSAFEFSQGKQKEQELDIKNEDHGAYLSDSNPISPDDFEEKPHLLFYWRFDEGKGSVVNDMTDNELHTTIDTNVVEWSEEPLEDGQPLDYEDKWGKQNSASYALQIDGFSGETKGLQCSLQEGIAEKMRLYNNFTLEFWVNIDAASAQNSFKVIETLNLQISIENNSSIKVCHNDYQQSIPLQSPLPLKIWSHLTLINCAQKKILTLLLNSQEILKTTLILAPQFQKQSQLTLLRTKNLRLSVTEIRFWTINLPISLIRENYKAPLALLYEQKRAFKIKIKKKQQSNNAAAPGGGLGLKKLGGLSGPSKALGKPKIQAPSSNNVVKEEDVNQINKISEQKQETQQVKEEQKAQNYFKKDEENKQNTGTFDAFDFGQGINLQQEKQQQIEQESSSFDFGFSNQSNTNQKIQKNSAFDFSDGFEQPIQPRGIVDQSDDPFGFSTPASQTQILSFDQYQNSVSQDFAFGFTSSETIQEKTIEKPASESFFFEESKHEPPKPLNLSKTTIKKDVITKSHLHTPQSTDQLQSHDSTTSPMKPKRLIMTPSQAATFIKPLWDPVKDEREISHIQQILDALTQSKLHDAEQLINTGISQTKGMVSSQGQEVDKEKLKKYMRAYVMLKLAAKIGYQIAVMKQQEPSEDNLSQIASLANMLIILQIPQVSNEDDRQVKLKKAYLQFALSSNLKIKNYSALGKIVSFYQKQVPEGQITDDEKKKIDQIEQICKKYNYANHSSLPGGGYLGADCPHCKDPLIFGLATPQCPKCRSKIGLCYLSLTPVIAEKAPKCNLCLAKYQQSEIAKIKPSLKGGVLCPLCQLSKVD